MTEYTETKASRKNLPAEEGITGSDAAGRAKRVSSEKQTEDDLSRNTSRLEEGRQETKQGAVHNELTTSVEKRLRKVEKKLEIEANSHI